MNETPTMDVWASADGMKARMGPLIAAGCPTTGIPVKELLAYLGDRESVSPVELVFLGGYVPLIGDQMFDNLCHQLLGNSSMDIDEVHKRVMYAVLEGWLTDRSSESVFDDMYSIAESDEECGK